MSFDTPVLELEDVAGLLKCEPTKVEELLRTGVLTGAKFGRSWVIPTAALIQRINELAVEQAAARRAPAAATTPVAAKAPEPRRRALPALG